MDESAGTTNVETGPPQVSRRALLPIWIKVFIWIFMIAGAVAPLGILVSLFGGKFAVALYGWETHEPFSVVGLFLMGLFLFKGITAYSLWTQKNWGIILAQVDAVVGIGLCVFMMMIFPFIDDNHGFSFTFRAELLLLIPYLIKLGKIKQDWKGASIAT